MSGLNWIVEHPVDIQENQRIGSGGSKPPHWNNWNHTPCSLIFQSASSLDLFPCWQKECPGTREGKTQSASSAWFSAFVTFIKAWPNLDSRGRKIDSVSMEGAEKSHFQRECIQWGMNKLMVVLQQPTSGAEIELGAQFLCPSLVLFLLHPTSQHRVGYNIM